MTDIPQPRIPGPAERAELNATFLQHGIDTGFYNDHGNPAPWPDDIDEWRPVTNDAIRLNPGEQPF